MAVRIQPWMGKNLFPLVAVGLLFFTALVLPAFLAIIPEIALVVLATAGVARVLRLDERFSSPVVRWTMAIGTIMVANMLVAVAAILATWLVLVGLPLYLVLAWQGAGELVRRWLPGAGRPFPTPRPPPVSGTSSRSSPARRVALCRAATGQLPLFLVRRLARVTPGMTVRDVFTLIDLAADGALSGAVRLS